MNNLEALRKRTKHKLIVMSLSTLTPIIILVILNVASFEEKSIAADMITYRYVIAFLLEMAIIYKLVKYSRILKNDEFANEILLKKNDERNKFIRVTSLALAIKITIYIICISMIVAAFLSEQVFYTLLAVILTALITYSIVKLYYYKKF